MNDEGKRLKKVGEICAVEFRSAVRRTEGHLCSRLTLVDSHRRNLPHWGCEGGLIHVTFRLADSMPEHLLAQFRDEKEDWLRNHVGQLSAEELAEYDDLFVDRIDRWLDNGHGSCVLAHSDCREVVESALEYFNDDTGFVAQVSQLSSVERASCPLESVERASCPLKNKEIKNSSFLNGQDARSTLQDARSPLQDARSTLQDARAAEARYRLHCYVVMPNHVHVLMELYRRDGLARIVQSWKSFTSKRINALVGRTGKLWQAEYFDRLIRTTGQYERTLDYIKKNAGGNVRVK